jgi:hypothetical protein
MATTDPVYAGNSTNLALVRLLIFTELIPVTVLGHATPIRNGISFSEWKNSRASRLISRAGEDSLSRILLRFQFFPDQLLYFSL